MVGGRHFALMWILSGIDWRVTEQKSRTNERKEVQNLEIRLKKDFPSSKILNFRILLLQIPKKVCKIKKLNFSSQIPPIFTNFELNM